MEMAERERQQMNKECSLKLNDGGLYKRFYHNQLTDARSKTAVRVAAETHGTHLEAGVRVAAGLALGGTLVDGQLGQRHLHTQITSRRQVLETSQIDILAGVCYTCSMRTSTSRMCISASLDDQSVSHYSVNQSLYFVKNTHNTNTENTRYAQRPQTSADPEDPDFGLWTPGSEA